MNLQWLQDLPADDPPASLESAVLQLRELALSGVARLQQLTTVDAALQPHLQALTEHYVTARRLPAEEESRLWEAAFSLHEQLTRGYVACLKEVTEKTIPVAEAPALTARILYHRGRSALWRYLRYVDVPAGWWLDMHKLYAFAERENFAARQLALYPDEPQTTCSTLYMQSLLLGTLNRTNMTRDQIEYIYHWLQPWSARMPLETEFLENDQLFFVNLAEDRGGRRIRNFEPTASCRYWRTDAIVKEIEYDLGSLESGTQQATGLDSDILEQLHSEWSHTSYKRQRRTSERSEVKKTASVAHGIYAVCQEVRSQALGSTVLELGGELWVIENESRYGFGAVVSTELNAWLKVGRLIALREELNIGMSVVGVVRSLKQHDAGKVYVGIEVLSHMALYGTLRDMPDPAGAQPFPTIFLPSDEERGQASSLLLPATEYQADGEFHLRIDRRARHIRFSRLLEQKDDWCWVEIVVLSDLAS